MTLSALREQRDLAAQFVLDRRRQRIRRQRARRIAGMHAGFLDVLHDAADQHVAFGVGDDVDVDFAGMIEEAVEQHRRGFGDAHGLADVARKIGVVVHDLHRAAAEHVARAHDERIADLARERERFVGVARDAVRRLRQPELVDELLETLAILGEVDRIGRRADDRRAGGFERARELQRRLAAVLHDEALRLFLVDDLQHVFERQRLEVQAVGRVVVGRHGFRIAVDHDRLVAVLAKRERGMDAAVVELDALPDAVRAAAEHDDLVARRRIGLALFLVGRIHVGGRRRELGSARIDALVDRTHAERAAQMRGSRSRRCRRARRCARRKIPCASAGACAPRRSRARPADFISASIATRFSIWARNHGSMCVSANTSSRVNPARNASAT